MKKRWKVPPANKELQEVFSRELNILPLTGQLLVNRGLVDADKASYYLNPELKSLHDPFLLLDMEKAASRAAEAVAKGEKIAVYGDYDVDGTTSTALLFLFFRELGVEVVPYIPDRREGYGLNGEAVKKLSRAGVKLIITADCGTSDHDEVLLAGESGIDVIVTDHHEVSKGAPPAFAFINPKRKDCPFPFKGLAGVGVAFNFAMALRAKLRSLGAFRGAEPNLKKYLDLVSIGTISDMVPLRDENRVLVSHGLLELERTGRIGLQALKDVSGIRGRVDAHHVAFQLAPRINAAGRISHSNEALKLLTTGERTEAATLAAAIDGENSRRQRIEEEILREAMALVTGSDRGIVVSSEGWHPGVIGIVASRLVERFAKPCVIISVEGEVCKGSARGIRGVDILEGLSACSPLLERYGGHRAAAGLTLARKNLEGFRAEFLRHMNSTLSDEDLVPEVNLDADVTLSDMNFRLMTEIGTMAPFGASNPEPLFSIRGVNIMNTAVVGGKHLKFRLKQNGCVTGGIGFGMAGLHPVGGDGFSLAFSPYVDQWQGAASLGLRVRDIQRA